MASLDFDLEKSAFRKYYEADRKGLAEAKNAFIRIIGSALRRADVGEVTKIEGRIKDREECINKFHRKYQAKLEAAEQPYEIKDYLTDLIGIRIVCLYEDQIPVVAEALQQHFRILDVTDRISAVESTEDSFGYKGLHMDLALNERAAALPRYLPYAQRSFEVQIRSLIQDAWSVLDHKIKYKKSIPVDLKRRINVLSALFELADREFREIRNATAELIRQAKVAPIGDAAEDVREIAGQVEPASPNTLNAFSFLRIGGHFFRDFEFEPHKLDDFVQDIVKLAPGFRKSDLHRCLHANLKCVKEYRDRLLQEDSGQSFSPYTTIRHCLYLGDPETFRRILSKRMRERFAKWLKSCAPNGA